MELVTVFLIVVALFVFLTPIVRKIRKVENYDTTKWYSSDD